MVDLQLQPGENIILTKSNVTTGLTGFGAGELVLTDKNIIFYKKAMFGNTIKSIEKHPLESVTLLNGEPRVMAKSNQNGNVSLCVYAGDKALEYCFFNDYTKGEVIRWVNAIFNLIVGHDSKEQGDASSILGKAKSLLNSGGGMIGESAASLIGNFKNKLDNTLSTDENVTLTKKCPGCGAPITGYKGENKQCEYCGSSIKI